MLILALFFASFSTLAQSLKDRAKAADKIYIEPIRGRNLVTISVASPPMGSFVEYLSREKAKPGEKFKDDGAGANRLMVGEITTENQQWANDLILSRCKDYFGADKMQLWPEDQFRDKWNGGPNGKAVDSDFYIIVECRDFRIDAAPYEAKSQTTYKFMGALGPIKIKLFEKVKAGKKGKNLATGKNSPLESDLLEDIVIEDMEIKLHPELEKSVHVINDNFKNAITQALDEFFEAIEKGK